MTVTGCEPATVDPVDPSLRHVTAALESGRIRASTLLHDTRFVALRQDPATRPAVRELVRTHVTESDVLMITDEMTGRSPTATIRRATDGTWEAEVSIPVQPIG